MIYICDMDKEVTSTEAKAMEEWINPRPTLILIINQMREEISEMVDEFVKAPSEKGVGDNLHDAFDKVPRFCDVT